MSCVYPLVIKNPRTRSPIQVPCGQCMNCRLSKTMSLSFLANLELQKCYRLGKSSSFVTLTYSDQNVPYVKKNGYVHTTLRKEHLQKFFKRFRECLRPFGYSDNSYKIISCGEYGDKFDRCHFHFVAIGLNSVVTEYAVDRSWKYGLTDVGVLFAGGLNYVCKYMTKSVTGRQADALYTDNGLEKPFLTHSINIGSDWINEHLVELVENNYCYYNAGVLHPLPSYIRRKLDSAKLFDKSAMMARLMDSARAAGYDSLSDYSKIKSFNCEKMLIDYSRSKGIPVNSMNFFEADKVYDINDFNDIVSPVVKEFASQALLC